MKSLKHYLTAWYLVMLFGVIATLAVLTGCKSIQTSDCLRDIHGKWYCVQK